MRSFETLARYVSKMEKVGPLIRRLFNELADAIEGKRRGEKGAEEDIRKVFVKLLCITVI